MKLNTYRVIGIIALVVVVIALIFAGSQVMASRNANNQPELAGMAWNLVGWSENGTDSQTVEGSRPTLEFNDEGGLYGTSGCNLFNGSYELNGQQMSVGELMQTLMACDEAVMQQENDYMRLLRDAQSYSIAGDTLTIVTSSGSLSFVRA